MPRLVFPLLLLLAGWVAANSARAQGAPAPTPTTAEAPRDDQVRVFLVTVGPGKEVWERFGHNMIWIHDPQQRPGGPDAAYNWGIFDFSNFISNFLKKNMRYCMEAWPAGPVIEDYINADRSVWLQELNLTAQQKEQLLNNVEFNRLPENKFYNYDYYTDNCSTRVRDSLDRVLDGAIKKQFEPVNTNTTYRWHTRRLVADDWPTDLALDYAEGPYVDRKINQWEESFLPVRFMQHLRNVSTANGPLILSERTLHLTNSYPERETEPNRLAPYSIVGIVIGAAMLPFGMAKRRRGRWPAAVVIFFWCLLGTIGSIALMGLWFATPHIPPKHNENILALGPLSIVLLVMFPFFRRASRVVMIIAISAAAISVVGLLVQILPGLDQVNGDIIGLTLPANLGLAVAFYLAHQRVRKTLVTREPHVEIETAV